ncbi:hypothetical protein [Nocardioides lijunqiniae]|uniref:hypothetical protein n=1 Tax=Nocardioides lijunqiniae TaxID=2760832 RepID=UPI001877D13A|nr:hypothetical protein [Nocardioides lijunqiniae]
MLKRTTALIAGSALLAVPAVTLVAAPASADVERSGACGGGRYELSVDREGAGWEVNADLDRVAPGSRWRVVLKHDGRTFYSKVRTADREGDLDVERFRRDTAGKDSFRLVAKRVNGTATCARTITVG